MEANLHVVKYHAAKLHSTLPDCVELDDLFSAGVFGLADAVEKFDPERGVKFSTYASPRIWGAMRDWLREMDWTPRLVRSRTSRLTAATNALTVKLNREPNDDELAMSLKVDAKELKKMRLDAAVVTTSSLSQKWFETDTLKDVTNAHLIADTKALSPSARLDQQSMIARLCEGMNRSESTAFRLYWFDQMTMRECGRALGLSESRVSQMMSSLLLRVKARFSEGKLRDVLGLLEVA